MECNPIIIGTSLAPFNIEKQMRAVKSWIDNCFYVISCNTKEEIEVLKPFFSEVSIEFVEVSRTAEKEAKKKLPYLQDILNIVSGRTEAVCGFINSDIILSKMPNEMYKFIENEAKNSLVFVRRNEINEYGDIKNLNWTFNFDGIDAFFIDKKIAENFFDDGFYVQTMWDLCILLKCKILNIKIKELMNPIAFHLRHAITWDFKESGRLIDQFVKKNFGIENHTYKYAKDLWYRILYEDCEKICFCNKLDYRCLFALNNANEDTIRNINKQDYENKEIFLGEMRKDIEKKYDVIFLLDERVVLSNVFCKEVIYIMDQFGCDRLHIGRLFVSEDTKGRYYNELNRNTDVLNRINSDCKTYTCAYKAYGDRKGDEKVVYQAISYEMIDLTNSKIVDKVKIPKEFYIIPAGVKASEWLSEWNSAGNDESHFLGFIDNNPQKIGSEIMGRKIYSIKRLLANPEAMVILASRYYSVEIAQQLKHRMIPNQILNVSYMLSINDDNTVYYFNIEKYMKITRD